MGGSLKRSVGMVSSLLAIPKASGFEAATLRVFGSFENWNFEIVSDLAFRYSCF